MKTRLILIVAALALLSGCSPRLLPAAKPSDGFARPEGFAGRYTLTRAVVLSRHNMRSPLSGKGSLLSRITPHEWFDWTSEPGELSLKGGTLETQMGQYFRQWMEAEGLFAKDEVPGEGAVRFWANSMQRTRATARYFAAGFLPMADIGIEQHCPLGTMDPVFFPRITKISDSFVQKAQQQIADMGGPEKIEPEYALLEKVLDMRHSPAARNDTTGFGIFPSKVSFALGAEPAMSGGLKMACSAADALVLQYYEEPDPGKAAFGHRLATEDWTRIASVKDWYQDLLFSAPAVAVNVAHPMLEAMLSELETPGRKFTFLCGHDSNVASVLSALGTEEFTLPESIENKTPIGVKLMVEVFSDASGSSWADILLVCASQSQLREVSSLSMQEPPLCIQLRLQGLTPNADGLYPLSEVAGRFREAIKEYDSL